MSELSKQALQVENTQSFPNNTTGYITPTLLRTFNSNAIDSTVNQTVYTSDSGSWNTKINNLNAFTASQQPSFTALNSFTASQLTINSGVNLFTQSAASSISQLNVQTASFYAFTASVNQVMEEGTVLGYSTRFNYRGALISASVTPNVSGLITNIDVISDDTKTNTSSFNAYTASTNQQLDDIEIWSGSAKVSIAAFGAFTASYGPVATGSLVATASYSGTTLTYTKGDSSTFTNVGIQNTASFNSYTSSTNIRLNNIEIATASLNTFSASAQISINSINSISGSWITESETGSFARVNTSNSFTGSQTFSGSVITTGSVSGNIVSISISSNTASMDLSKGNFFLLTLATGSVTRLEASNISKGQTANLLVSQASVGTGSLLLSSTFKQPVNNSYTASAITSAKDIISFVSFDSTSTLYATSIQNLT